MMRSVACATVLAAAVAPAQGMQFGASRSVSADVDLTKTQLVGQRAHKMGVRKHQQLSMSLFHMDEEQDSSEEGATHVTSGDMIHKNAYFGKLLVGTPPQEFRMIFDTGSGNVILPDSSCTTPGCAPHTKFVASASSSMTDINLDGSAVGGTERDMVTITFGTGEIEGVYAKDIVCLDIHKACTNLNFISATKQSNHPFAHLPFDGIVGMGFGGLAEGKGFSLMEELQAAHQFDSNLFSVYMGSKGSEITFGGHKPDRMKTSDIFWVPVTKKFYWQIELDDMSTNGNKMGVCASLFPSTKKCQVAVDSGTNVLAGPAALFQSISKQVQLKADCSNYDTAPDLSLHLHGRELRIAKEHYIEKKVVSTYAGKKNSCRILYLSLDIPPPNGPLIVLGTPFFQSFYTMFDLDNERLGFSENAAGGATPQISAVATGKSLRAAAAAAVPSTASASRTVTVELTPFRP